jgi:hypothetical protein
VKISNNMNYCLENSVEQLIDAILPMSYRMKLDCIMISQYHALTLVYPNSLLLQNFNRPKGVSIIFDTILWPTIYFLLIYKFTSIIF